MRAAWPPVCRVLTGIASQFSCSGQKQQKWEIEKFSISYRSYRLAASAMSPRQADLAPAFALLSSPFLSLARVVTSAQQSTLRGPAAAVLDFLLPSTMHHPPALFRTPILAQYTRDDQM